MPMMPLLREEATTADVVKRSTRKAARNARQSIAHQAEMVRKRTWTPFQFSFSKNEDECKVQIADTLNNISIGDFNKELEAESQETLISDDEDKENIEAGEDVAANLSSDTFTLEQPSKLISPDGSPIVHTPKKDEQNKILSAKNSPSASGYLKKTKASAARAALAPRNTPTTEYRKSLKGGTPKTPFDLKESLKKKPSWKMHTGKLKPVGQAYTPEAKKNFARVSKVQQSRDDARQAQKSRAGTSRLAKVDKGRKLAKK